jgi:spermidine/putrescine transport system ATP-binding protein
MAEPLVKLIGLRKEFHGTVAVEGIELAIGAGEFVVLLGPSGSGKTTILSMLGGFVGPTAGRIVIGGADVTALPAARRPTATVFQDYALFPHMSVAGNVGFGLAMHKVPRRERQRRVEKMLSLVGLEGLGRRAVHQLSGGQQQRVALARAIAVEPAVLLLDEPLGALDFALRRQMQGELVRIQKEVGTTFIHVTHDQEEAMSIADTVVVLNSGRVEDAGPPDRVYLRPASRFAATFMGESNLLEGKVSKASGGLLEVETVLGTVAADGKAAVGDVVHLSIRPEQIGFDSGGGNLVPLGAAVIVETSFSGTHYRARAKAGPNGEVDLLLRLPQRCAATPGSRVEFGVRRDDIVILRD